MVFTRLLDDVVKPSVSGRDDDVSLLANGPLSDDVMITRAPRFLNQPDDLVTSFP